MKKLVGYTLILILFVGINSCKKVKDNPFSDVNNFGKGTYLTLVKTINANFDYSVINTSTVGITVDGYAGGEAVDKVIIFATTDGSYDTTAWHLVKTVTFTTGGTDLKVSGAELATALGTNPTDLAPGTSYTFYTRLVTKSGRTFDVNNTSNNGGSAFVTGPNYNGAFSFEGNVVCPYSGSAAGKYVVVQDDWADRSEGDTVQVLDGSAANTINLSQVWPNPAIATVVNPLIFTVVPATGAATSATGLVWGHYHYIDGAITYDYDASNLSGSSGYVFSCIGIITVQVHITLTGFGDQGVYKLVLRKVP